MGEEADALIAQALMYEEDPFDCTYYVQCKFCGQRNLYWNDKKLYASDGTLHKCPEIDMASRRLSTDAIMLRLRMNF